MNTDTPAATVSQNTQNTLSGMNLNIPEVSIDEGFVARLKSFLEGKITWAQVEGWTPQMAYRFASLGFDLMRSGKLEDSKRVFSSLHTINPKDWYFPYSLAQVERLMGNHEQALDLLDRSIAIDPTMAEPWLLKGICQMEMGSTKDARESLIQSLELGKKRTSVEMTCPTVPLSTALLERLSSDN